MMPGESTDFYLKGVGIIWCQLWRVIDGIILYLMWYCVWTLQTYYPIHGDQHSMVAFNFQDHERELLGVVCIVRGALYHTS